MSQNLTYKHFGALRLGLAVLVVVQHFVSNLAPIGPLFDAIVPGEVGSLAVLVFFCLSGFVITEAAVNVYPGKPAAFIANRFLRIVPHYLAALAISILVHLVFLARGTLRIAEREPPSPARLEHAFQLKNIAANLFGFMPGADRLGSFDFVDIVWAVRIEMLFYFLVLGCIVLCLAPSIRRIGPMRLFYAGFFLLVPCLLLAAFGLLPGKIGLASYFVFGAALYLQSSGRRTRPIVWLSLAGIALHFLTLPLVNPQSGQLRHHVGVQAIILAALLATMVYLALHRFSRFRPLDRSLGDLSYPLYMHHQNVEIVLFSLAGAFSYVNVYLGIPLAILFSYGTMRLIDPLVNRVRDRVRGRRTDTMEGFDPISVHRPPVSALP